MPLDLETKERVRQAVDIVDLVGSYIQLRHQGRDFVGLCPWHDDSRPSLRVSPTRQSFKCFVCDIGGDVFSFVQQMEGVNFPEALELLAERAGITLQKKPSRPVTPGGPDDKKTLLAAMEWAAREYHRFLLEGESAQPARDYLERRNISAESIVKFQIGYAPNEWDWLLKRARMTSFSGAVLERIGLVVPRSSGDGYYDRFRGRVLFTIRDCASRDARPIALGGRILPEFAEGEPAKYINSPETPLFQKNRQLYGFDQARDHVQKLQDVLVMEGYTDCVLAHQHGVSNAVAVLGTALGEQHVRFLQRFTENVTLVLDGDEAGQRRTNEVLGLFFASQLNLRILTLPQSLDPCDFLVSHGSEAFARLLDEAVDALEHKLRVVTQGLDLLTDTHRANEALEDVLGTIARAPRMAASTPASVRLREQQFLRRIARTFRTPEEDLRARLAELRRGGRPAVVAEPVERVRYSLADLAMFDREVLELILAFPASIDTLSGSVTPDDLTSRLGRTIYAKCVEIFRGGEWPSLDRLMLETEDFSMKDFLVRLDEQSQAKAASDASARVVDVLSHLTRRKEDERHQKTILAIQQGDAPDSAVAELVASLRARQHGRPAPKEG